VDHVRVGRGGAAAERVVQCGEVRLPVRVDQDAVDLGQGVVPGRAVGLPPGRQGLAVLEDLLDEHVRTVGGLREALQIAAGIDQPVGVVDPQSVREALPDPAQHLGVRPVEHLGDLHAHTGERRDGEEAPVVELRGLAAPEDRLPVLPCEDRADPVRVVGCRSVHETAGGQGQDVLGVEAHEAVRGDLGRLRLDPHVAVGDHVVDPRPEDRHTHPAVPELPVDVEGFGVA
jgi:hypothetical protein